MDTELHDPHYLRHVTALADKHEVIAHTAIFSRKGIKLVDSGHRITRLLYDELVGHKLLPQIEECLTIDDAVTAVALMRNVEELLDQEPAFAELVPAEADRRQLIRGFATLPLEAPLAFKLTVAREERPEILRHSLRVAYCAAALAHHCHMAHHEITNAAAAGLFHDLGLLHVDPELLKSGRHLLEQERHHLYSHPLTAYLMLERNPVWHPVVSTAVLEHHERLDGSGYPRGLAADRLGPLGQLLAVAELAATLLAGAGALAPRRRLGVVLRMNEGKLNHEYCSRLLALLPPEQAAQAPGHRLGDVLEVLVDLAIALLRWQAIAKRQPDSPLTGFIGKRMERLTHSLAAAGIDLEYWSAMDADVEFDTRSLGEMEVSAREGVWQLNAIAQEVRRRWDHLLPGSEPAVAAVGEWLDSIDALQRL